MIEVTINNAALAEMYGVKAGATLRVPTQDGVPTVREWRNRFRDAVVDDCISIIQGAPPAPKRVKKRTQESD